MSNEPQPLKIIQKKYGKTPAVFVKRIHDMCLLGEDTISVTSFSGIPEGIYAYPYPFFTEQMGYTSIHCSMILKKLRDVGILIRVKIGGTPFYHVNYEHPDVVNSGIFKDGIA